METKNTTTGSLFSGLIQELRTLVSKEFELAKTEMSEKASKSVRNSIVIAVGASLIYMGSLVLLAAAVFGLANVVPLWLSALIVGAVTLVIGAIVTYAAVNKLKKMKIKPEHTMENLRKDRQWLLNQRERAAG